MSESEFKRRIEKYLDSANSKWYEPYIFDKADFWEMLEEAKKEFPVFDITKPIDLETYSGLNVMEVIYLHYREEVEKWFNHWFGEK